MDAYTAEGWADFAVAAAGVGAALTGLLFVALSINLEAILRTPRLVGRAAHTLFLLVTPVVTALLLLVPGQPSTALGVELILTGVAVGAALSILDPPWRRSAGQNLGTWLIGTAVPALLLVVSLLASGIGLLTEALGGLYWIPAGVIAAVLGGLLTAWVLLVEILR